MIIFRGITQPMHILSKHQKLSPYLEKVACQYNFSIQKAKSCSIRKFSECPLQFQQILQANGMIRQRIIHHRHIASHFPHQENLRSQRQCFSFHSYQNVESKQSDSRALHAKRKVLSMELLELYKKLPVESKNIYIKCLIEKGVELFFMHARQIDHTSTWINIMAHMVEVGDEANFKKVQQLFFQNPNHKHLQHLTAISNLELKLIGKIFGFQSAFEHYLRKFQTRSTAMVNKSENPSAKSNTSQLLLQPTRETLLALLELAVNNPVDVKLVLDEFATALQNYHKDSEFISLLALYNWNQKRYKKALQLILDVVAIGRNRKSSSFDEIFIPIQAFQHYCQDLEFAKLNLPKGRSPPTLLSNKIMFYIVENVFTVNESILQDANIAGSIFLLTNHLLHHMTKYDQFQGKFYSPTITNEIANKIVVLVVEKLKDHRFLWRVMRRLHNHPFTTHWGPFVPSVEVWALLASVQRPQKSLDFQSWHDEVFKYAIQEMLALYPERESRDELYQFLKEKFGAQAITLFHFHIPYALEFSKYYFNHGDEEGSSYIRYYMRQFIKTSSLRMAIQLQDKGQLNEINYVTPTGLY